MWYNEAKCCYTHLHFRSCPVSQNFTLLQYIPRYFARCWVIARNIETNKAVCRYGVLFKARVLNGGVFPTPIRVGKFYFLFIVVVNSMSDACVKISMTYTRRVALWLCLYTEVETEGGNPPRFTPEITWFSRRDCKLTRFRVFLLSFIINQPNALRPGLFPTGCWCLYSCRYVIYQRFIDSIKADFFDSLEKKRQNQKAVFVCVHNLSEKRKYFVDWVFDETKYTRDSSSCSISVFTHISPPFLVRKTIFLNICDTKW